MKLQKVGLNNSNHIIMYMLGLIDVTCCFVSTGIFIVILSILIMYYNIGLPNSLRGFVFYSQVSNHIYGCIDIH